MSMSFKWHPKNRSGKNFWVEVNLKGTCLEEKNIVLAVVRDITERKLKDEELKKLNHQLKKINILQEKSRVKLNRRNDELEVNKEKLEDALSQLETRNFELDQLLYKTSHDLTAPLNSMLGLVNLAQIEDPIVIKHYWPKMENSIVRMKRFIKSMLDYGKPAGE